MPISRSEGREEIVSAKYVGYDSERGCKSRMGTLAPHDIFESPEKRRKEREIGNDSQVEGEFESRIFHCTGLPGAR